MVSVVPAVPATKTPIAGEKSGKPKKAKAAGKEPKSKKSKLALKTVASPPSYVEMIKKAFTTLKEKKGSSLYAITKYVEEKYSSFLPSDFKDILSSQLKKLVEQGKVTKVKDHFKLALDVKEPVVSKPKAETKPKAPAKTKTPAVKPKYPAKLKIAKKPAAAKVKPSKAVKAPKASKVVILESLSRLRPRNPRQSSRR